MTYEEIRAALRQHFETGLEVWKARIREQGRLSELDLDAFRNGIGFAEQSIAEKSAVSFIDGNDEPLLAAFIQKHALDIQKGTRQYDQLQSELRVAWRDFQKAVVEYDGEFDSFDFTRADKPHVADAGSDLTSSLTLEELISAYTKERKAGKNWGSKTEIEKADHFKLLQEIVGKGQHVSAMSAFNTKAVKDVLLSYPKNRSKNPKTRGRPLQEVLDLADVEKIQVATINKYLQSYNDLFEWAKSNGHIAINLFSGMTVKQGRRDKSKERDAYTDDEMKQILDQIIVNSDGFVTKDYQKWASLIGIFTGARLGEISQLHLKDVRMERGIWCFDMNDDGDRKSLKTAAARRLVPVHDKLIELGLLDFLAQLRARNITKVFPDFTHDDKNGWGRQQSRWFNDRLLVKLGLKSKTRVFHSLRHTVNTRLVQAGVPDPMVKAILGHEQEGMTQKQYFKEGYTLEQLSVAMQKLSYGY